MATARPTSSRLAPAVFDGEAVRDQLVVLFCDRGASCRSSMMPGPDFVDGDAELGEPMGPELRGHRDAGLADAVVAAVDRGFGRADATRC